MLQRRWHAPERASSYLIELLPTFTGAARQLLFEHSPGRGIPKFTADYTAFDALIRTSYPPENQCPLYGLLWRKLFTENNAAPHQTVL